MAGVGRRPPDTERVNLNTTTTSDSAGAVYGCYRRVLAALEENAVDVALLRDPFEPQRPVPGDLDLLVGTADFAECVRAVAREVESGYAHHYVRYTARKAVFVILCGVDLAQNIHEALVIGKIEIAQWVTLKPYGVAGKAPGVGARVYGEEVIKVRAQHEFFGPVTIPSPEWELCLLAYHNRIKPKARYEARIAALQSSVGEGDPFRLPALASAAQPVRRLVRALVNTSMARPEKPLIRQRIAFSGPDGSGKTTVTLLAMAWLRAGTGGVASVKTLRLATLQLVRSVWWAKQIIMGSERHTPGKVGSFALSSGERDREKPGSLWRLRRAVGLVAACLDQAIVGRVYLLAAALRGADVVIETAPWDAFVKRHRPEFPLIQRVLLWMTPRVSSVYMCVATPDSIVRRKPELSAEEIADYYARIDGLSDSLVGQQRRNIATDVEPLEMIEQLLRTLT